MIAKSHDRHIIILLIAVWAAFLALWARSRGNVARRCATFCTMLFTRRALGTRPAFFPLTTRTLGDHLCRCGRGGDI